MSHHVHANVLYSIMVFIILINEWSDKVKGIDFFSNNFKELNQIFKPYITMYAKNGLII